MILSEPTTAQRLMLLDMSHQYFSKCEREARAAGNFDGATNINYRVQRIERRMMELESDLAFEFITTGTLAG